MPARIAFLMLLATLAAVRTAPAQTATTATLTVENPRCEYRANPLGIDTMRPRLSWQLKCALRGTRQEAYQVLVASSPDLLAQDKGDLWDSGKVISDQSQQVPYAGMPLRSLQVCNWKVRVWSAGAAEPSAWSAPAGWAMGMLRASDWKAKWITYQDAASDKTTPPPLPLLRKTFNVAKPLKRALLSVCGLGFCEVSLNGEALSENVLDPGWKNYKKTSKYSTYYLTATLKTGPNALGVMLGNGMYNVTGGRYTKFKGSFGPLKLILQLNMEYTDGTTDLVVSDESWKGAPGPIRFSCIYGGEDYDARCEQPGWDTPGFNDAAWRPATPAEGPGGRLVAKSQPPIKVMSHIPGGARVTYPKSGIGVYNFGQNFAGWPTLQVKGAAGAKVKLTPGELLDDKGMVSQRSAGGGPISFSYILKGDGEEKWHPRFSYTGYRYVQCELFAADGNTTGTGLPKVMQMGAEFPYASAPQTSVFYSSNMVLNRIHSMVLSAVISNLKSVLTDCPHREKLSWLEQSHLLGRALMFDFELPTLYAKISRDMAEAQTPEGLVPDIAPEYVVFNGGFRDSPEWGSAVVINPWLVYQMYNDPRIIEQQYDVMAQYVAYLGTKAKDGIIAYGLGDWYDVGPKAPGASQLTSKGVTATAIYYQDLTIMRQAAALLGHAEDEKKYADLAAKTREAFNRAFFHPQTDTYDRGSQTALAMPLALGLAPEARRAAIAGKLVAQIRAGGNRVTAGDVGFHYLLEALAATGHHDVIFDMLTQDKGPGYVWQIKKKATTLTEAWDANPASSQNHFMLGHAEDWLFTGLGGITPAVPGFKQFTIKPLLIGDLKSLIVHYDSLYGKIINRWEKEKDSLHMEVSVPPNTTATLYVPAKSAEAIRESGQPLAKAEGVKFQKMEGGAAVLALASGSYAFDVKD